MQSYTHFSLSERESLRLELEKGKSLREIAKALGRNVSSISRELRRHGKKDGSYNAWWACSLYLRDRKKCRRKFRVETDTKLKTFICQGFDRFWSPEIIAAKWNQEQPENPVSHSTIYSAIRRKKLAGYTEKGCLRRRGARKYRNRGTGTIRPERRISERPDVINSRRRVGDWEGDLLGGGVGKGALVTLVDRKSRYLTMAYVPDKSAQTTGNAIKAALRRLPVKSVTLDNGPEFAGFRGLESDLGAPIYFADPHSPWQRGSNENMNGLLRWFFPKGFDFRNISDADIRVVQDFVNDRPRKCLGWLSARDVFFATCCT